MKTLADVKVGDEVLVISTEHFGRRRTREPRSFVVEKVGTKLIHARPAGYPSYPTEAYYIATGLVRGEVPRERIATEDMLADEQRAAQALEELKRYELEPVLGATGRFTSAQLEAVIKALAENSKEPR